MLRADWRPGGFGREPLSSNPIHVLRVEVVDIVSSAFVSLSLGVVAFLVCFRHST